MAERDQNCADFISPVRLKKENKKPACFNFDLVISLSVFKMSRKVTGKKLVENASADNSTESDVTTLLRWRHQRCSRRKNDGRGGPSAC